MHWGKGGRLDFLLKSVFLVIIGVAVISCGNGSGNPDKPARSGSVLNPGLSGYLVLEYKRRLWKISLSTGRVSKISEEEVVPLGSAYLSPAAYTGDEFVMAVNRCIPGRVVSCIFILDKNAKEITWFDIPNGSIKGAPKLSRDRQYVAFEIEYGGGNIYLEIYDRSGNLISDDFLGTSGVRLYIDWLRDGSLVYSNYHDDVSRKIYVTSPYSAKVVRDLTLPAGLEGKVGEIVASPDGKQLVFSIVDQGSVATTAATPWVVNVDGSNFHQLAVDPHAGDGELTYINDPKWSSDGKWILVRYGGAIGGGISNPGTAGYLFAVPSDGVNVPLSPYDDSIETTAIPVYHYWLSDVMNINAPADNRLSNLQDYDWIL